MSRLITSSLIGSIRWLEVCPQSWKKRAYESLRSTLAREWTEPEGPAKLGIDFENTLYSIFKSHRSLDSFDSSEQFKEIVKYFYALPPMEIQKKIKRIIDYKGHEYCLYGKLDINCPDFIIDIKTTSKLMDSYNRKYLDSVQHHMYCYITETPDFRYFIVVFNNGKIHSTCVVNYTSPGMEGERKIIENVIDEVFRLFGERPELLKLYQNKYCY